jgi:hypothetical protein
MLSSTKNDTKDNISILSQQITCFNHQKGEVRDLNPALFNIINLIFPLQVSLIKDLIRPH